jgi:hypothetical protein
VDNSEDEDALGMGKGATQADAGRELRDMRVASAELRYGG